MKKLRFLLVLFVAILFASCGNHGSEFESIKPDTAIVVEEDICSVEDGSVKEVDTIHCRAFTKAGKPCKNHVAHGDTLCRVHKAQRDAQRD